MIGKVFHEIVKTNNSYNVLFKFQACHIEIEVDEVKVTALKAIFDILLVFGLELFESTSSASESINETQSSCSNSSQVGQNCSSLSDSKLDSQNLQDSSMADESTKGNAGSKLMLALLCKHLDSEVRFCFSLILFYIWVYECAYVVSNQKKWIL